MSVSMIAAAILAGQSALSLTAAPAPLPTVDVAYAELAAGQPLQAVHKLEAAGAARSDDPATLINLGAAYARAGMSGKALGAYRAAVSSPVRYDLQLADGSWVDSRFAARQALKAMVAANTMALR